MIRRLSPHTLAELKKKKRKRKKLIIIIMTMLISPQKLLPAEKDWEQFSVL